MEDYFKKNIEQINGRLLEDYYSKIMNHDYETRFIGRVNETRRDWDCMIVRCEEFANPAC